MGHRVADQRWCDRIGRGLCAGALGAAAVRASALPRSGFVQETICYLGWKAKDPFMF